MAYRLGLTGGVGMGKSTASEMFRDLGHLVWDADQAVHRLYATNGLAVEPIAAAFPEALSGGRIDRQSLKNTLSKDHNKLKVLEDIVHPLVSADRAEFYNKHQNAPLIVFDVPLLYESGSQNEMDGVAVVSTDPETQRKRVMSRPGMTNEHLEMILSRQMPDAEKRRLADWIIPTDTIDGARAAVQHICNTIIAHA